jgi:hypothetical protein
MIVENNKSQLKQSISYKDENQKVDFKNMSKDVHNKILKEEQANIQNLITGFFKYEVLYVDKYLDNNDENVN